MSSNSSDFLKQMIEAGEKHSASNDFLTVAKMIVKFGYSGFLTGHPASEFFKPYGNPKDADYVADEVSDRLKQLGSSHEARFAIMLNIPVATNTSEKVTWDIEQIVFTDNREDSEYQIFINALAKGNFPINEWFWGTYKNKEMGEYKTKAGETKKRYLSLPVQMFADEATARAAVGSTGTATATANDDTKWSATVRANYPDLTVFENFADEIHKWVGEALKGVPYVNDGETYPLPNPITPPKAKAYIANIYDAEPADIDLLPPPF